MSGICGVVGLAGRPVSRGEIDAMIAPLKRRGPDGASDWVGEGVALGHTLLTTTPEAAFEKLPLVHVRSGCVITADARLDNRDDLIAELELERRPAAIGDGELILLAYLKWGENCAEHLLGDFAFGIWDPRSNRFFAARDQVGMRQLIYCHRPGDLLLFATEPRAVIVHPRVQGVVNEGRIADFLLGLEAFDLRETFFEGVFRLPPAHTLRFDRGGLSCRRYWRPEPQKELKLGTDDEYAEAFLDVFGEAVRGRLRSNGPVGSMLSGGMDSSSVATVAARELADIGKSPLHTFSAVGPDFTTCPESRAVASAMAIAGIKPTLISHGDLGDYLEDLVRLTRLADEPFDGWMTLHRAIYVAARRAGINVVLDGVAGDLTVATAWTLAHRLRNGNVFEAWREARADSRFWGSFHPWPAHVALANAAWRAFAPRWLRRTRQELLAAAGILGGTNQSLISPTFARKVDVRDRHRRWRLMIRPGEGISPGQRAYDSAHPYLVAARERYDRVASAVGVEPRDPFADLRLMRFCLALPPEQLQRDGWPKLILRNAMAGLVPDEVRWRRGKEHLGIPFSREMFRLRPELVLRDEFAGTISPYVNLDWVKFSRGAGAYSKDFAEQHPPVYLAMWIDSVYEMVQDPGSK